MKLILISLVISIPLGWLLMNKWLQDYAYRITITWSDFITAGIAVLMVALITICWHAIKTALINPVKSLRSE